MNFDYHGGKTVENLSSAFSIPVPNIDDLFCPYSIGIEIEVKFRYYFPDIFDQYFTDGKFDTLTQEEKLRISTLIAQQETIILPQLEKVVYCGIPKGVDKYWEFSFNPVYNIKYLIQPILILKELNLIPSGRHSLHITLGGIKPTRTIYWILAYLQLLYIDKHRIQEALEKADIGNGYSWGKKGLAGILHKFQSDLEECREGFEFRTLYIDDQSDIIGLFTTLNTLLTMHHSCQHIEALDQLANKFKDFGLTDDNWGRPHQNQKKWEQYVEYFDDLSTFARTIKLE
jgi:hypothetical protein